MDRSVPHPPGPGRDVGTTLHTARRALSHWQQQESAIVGWMQDATHKPRELARTFEGIS